MSKKIISFITILCFLLLGELIQAQKINLIELHSMSSNKNWETSNKFLLSKGWEYYDSTVGDDEHYNTIIWSYEKSFSDDKKANGWIYIYSYDGLPNKVLYRFRKKEYYTTIKNSLVSNGYKLDDEEILDQRVIAKYSNTNYILELTYSREEDENDYSGSGSFTAYEITVYKKGGVYDPNNGKKEEYDENGNLAVEYFLKDGKAEGQIKFYNPNGTLRKTSNMKNGVENGTSTHYFYSKTDSLGSAVGKYKGEILNGNKNGKWSLNITKDNIEKTISYENYLNGEKNGLFTTVNNDSLIVGKYKSDKLNGSYTIYRDLQRMLTGGIINTDTLQLKKITTGFYINDKRTGRWRTYDLNNSLIEEGDYADSLKTGKWKYYYSTYLDENKVTDFSGKLFLEENYKQGKRDGISIQYSFFDEIEKPCDDDPTKMCTKKVFKKIKELSNYKDDLLNGPYELYDENNELLFKGQYLDGRETGIWNIRNTSIVDFWTGETIEKGEFENGKKQGKWERFNKDNKIIESYNFKDELLNGEQQTYIGEFVRVKRDFKLGELEKLTVLDTLGNTTKSFYLFDRTEKKFKCNAKKFLNNSTISTTYKVTLDNDEIIIPTFFSKYFEGLPIERKILDGPYEKIDNGLVIEKGNYIDNKKVDVWNFYYYDQNVQLNIDYGSYSSTMNEDYYDLNKQEPFSGEFIYKDLDTGITEERKIKDGKRNGTTRYKDANDKTIKKESYKDGVLKE
jgi:antitoxin component YwqK of YwqJK toxin-antitoxin module